MAQKQDKLTYPDIATIDADIEDALNLLMEAQETARQGIAALRAIRAKITVTETEKLKRELNGTKG